MTAAKPRFRESAAVVLLNDHGGDSLRVYWVLRGDAVSYMPGFHAFPGGTVLPEDAELEIDGVSDERERVLRACVIREAFEETGILVALAAPADPARLAEGRKLLLTGEATFPALARQHGWRFLAGPIVECGRWMTPPFASARFDTTFFLARLPAGQEASIVPGELLAGEWITPTEALARWKRGEATFAAPILETLRELAVGEDRLAERLRQAPERTGQPVRRIELKWGIVLQPMKTRPLPPATHTNAYLVGEREMNLIDPGSGEPEELEALFGLIERLGADGRRLTNVLVTHQHPDHTGGVEAVRTRYGVPVAAHAETADAVRADRVLGDGEVVSPGGAPGPWDLKALHTPGHARGHLCFLHERTHSLFSGDHVTGGAGTVIIDPPDGDMAEYIASLERLARLPIRTLFPAHGSPQGAAVRRIRGLIAHRREREAKVIAALEPTPRPLPALVERAYADTPRELWGYAERSLLAHLIKLEREGRAAREGDLWRAA